jgi:hypothetical protein
MHRQEYLCNFIPGLARLAAAILTIAGAADAYSTYDAGRNGGLTVGAGAMTYLAQESPSTGLTLDARYEYPVTSGIELEGSGTTAFSQSVQGSGTTVPVLLEGSLKLNAKTSGNVGLFGAAGMGYGAFLGTEKLQDGATFTVPLSLGATWQGERYGLAPRFTYRPVFGDQLGHPGTSADADSWTAVLDVRLPVL